MTGCEECLDPSGLPYHEPEVDHDNPGDNDEGTSTCAVCGHELYIALHPETLSPWTTAQGDDIADHEDGYHSNPECDSAEAVPGCPSCDEGMTN
jgi:hypothetical protein